MEVHRGFRRGAVVLSSRRTECDQYSRHQGQMGLGEGVGLRRRRERGAGCVPWLVGESRMGRSTDLDFGIHFGIHERMSQLISSTKRPGN